MNVESVSKLVRTMGALLAANRVAYLGILSRNLRVSSVQLGFVEEER